MNYVYPKKMSLKGNGLTLDETVGRYKPDDVLYIGAASGYLFIGNREEYESKIDALSQESFDHFDKLDSERAVSIIENWVPYRERMVKDTFGLSNGGQAIIFDGVELGELYPVYEHGGLDDEGCVALANAIISDAAREYIRWLKMDTGTFLSDDKRYAIERLERWFRSGSFGAISPISGDGLISTIRRRVLK